MKIQYASDLHLEFVDNVDYLKANSLEVVVTHHCPYINEVGAHYIGRLAGSSGITQ